MPKGCRVSPDLCDIELVSANGHRKTSDRRIRGDHPRGVERLRSGHLWIYRSDVRSAHAEPGAVVRLTDERGNFFGRAFYSDKSQISIRLLTREDIPIDRAFFAARIRRAAAYRELVVENSDAYRMVYSEADLCRP